MNRNQETLRKFEQGLNPQAPEKSTVKAEVKGYGEISSIFSVAGIAGWVFKRLPLFATVAEAEKYAANYQRYTAALQDAGLHLPADSITIVEGERVVLYVGQEEIAKENFCHNLLHSLQASDNIIMIGQLLTQINKVFNYNQHHRPAMELSIDGQVSNWARVNRQIVFVDTSTPLFKHHGKEQLDPELLLNSTPGILKWIIRRFFLQEVMDRYYDQRLVFIDLLANLHKEQKPELISEALQAANNQLPDNLEKISRKEVDNYYKEDKFIWQLFLSFRKIDRWFTNNILGRRYQFILPGKIKR